jgi:hypothetical protein
MLLVAEQVTELKLLYPAPEYFEEGQLPYVLLRDYPLPCGTTPAKCDLVLCPRERDSYPSRLFFSQQVTRSTAATTKDALNWNGNVRLMERNWFAYSWKLAGGPYSLAQILTMHLRALQ